MYIFGWIIYRVIVEMRFVDSDYGSDDFGNSDILDDVYYEVLFFNWSFDYIRFCFWYVIFFLMVLLFVGFFVCIVYFEEV